MVVYREEEEGVAGLKKIQDAVNPSSPPFRLSLDLNKKSSKAFSPKRMTFDNYVVDSKGVIRGVLQGTLRDRPKAADMLKILKELE